MPLPEKVSLVPVSSCERYVYSKRGSLVGMGGEEPSLLAGSPIGRCRGKPAPTHIMNNIRWTEALSLYEGKCTIFCASNVALVPDRLSIQAIETEQELFVARSAVGLHWQLSQIKGLRKATLKNGFKQS